MKSLSQEDIVQMVQEEDVEFIRLQFTDIFGNFRNLAVTSSQLSKILRNSVRFDGSAVEGFAEYSDADIFLHPILGTFETFPWRPQQGKVARMICDLYKADGEPYEGDPRNVLRRATEHAGELGFTVEVAPACEFFLFNTDENGCPTTNSDEKAGFFDMGPLDFGENARRDIVMALEDMNFTVEDSHHEKAPAQHEIDFKSDEALYTADNLMTFKLAVRTIARQHGLHATFMPKPRADVNGSGMHLYFSLIKDGRNILKDKEGTLGLCKEAEYFIGGIMKHIKGITAIANPLVNSYKRLEPGFNAPMYNAWGGANRTTLIRVPTAIKADETRFELCSPDSSANPYLMLALVIEAGLDGIKNQILPPAPVTENLNDLTIEKLQEMGIERLPKTLNDALDELEKDEVLVKALGDHIVKKYIAAKRKECARYRSSISQWELDEYLLKY